MQAALKSTVFFLKSPLIQTDKDSIAGFAAGFLSSLPPLSVSDVSLPDLTVILSAHNNVISE